MNYFNIGIFYLVYLTNSTSTTYYCSEFVKTLTHRYYPVKHCQRSNQTIIGVFNFDTVEECENEAQRSYALAFNFASKERGIRNLYEVDEEKENKTIYTYTSQKELIEEPEEFFNCQLLECPEFANFSQMINDTRFDYYSMYTNPPPPNNSTCLPSIGIFQYHHLFYNYTSASEVCIKSGGLLAHIVSESRTESISYFLKRELNNTLLEVAYVGLNESKSYEQFKTSTGEPIKCFKYRAWAPGHPKKRKKEGCVAITIENSWKMYNCNKKLPFLCEILTSAPNRTINRSKKCVVREKKNSKSGK